MSICKRVVIIPGNGAGDVTNANWYGWLNKKLNGTDNLSCELQNMPDPITARESIWLPFMKNSLSVDENTLIVGHSSGACAAVRFAEKYKVYGILLVGAYTSDLGDDNEKESGYFNRPWQWQKVKENCQWICQFGSTDDPFLSWSEQSAMAEGLGAELHKYNDKGHFMASACPDILKAILANLKKRED